MAEQAAADAALRNLARRKAASNPRRIRLMTTAIAGPTAMIVSGTSLLGLLLDGGQPWVALWLVFPSLLSIMVWTVIFAFLFLVSLAAFAVADRDTANDLHLLQTNGAEPDHLRRFQRFHAIIPGTRGVLIGAGIGLIAALVVSTIVAGISLQPLHWLTVPAGAAVPVAVAWSGVAFGASRQRASQPLRSVGSLGSQVAPNSCWSNRSPRAPWVVAASGLVAVTFGSLLFNRWRGFSIEILEPLGANLLIVGTAVLIIGLVMLLPGLFQALARRLRFGPGWFRYATTDLSRNPGRAGKAAGSMLLLTILTVMAVAGIESDSESSDGGALDTRYVITRSARQPVVGGIQAVLDDAAEIAGYTSTRVNTRSVELETEPGFGPIVQAAVLDDVLIEALDLTGADVAAANDGAILINSSPLAYGMSEIKTGSALHVIGHGEGLYTPLAALVGPDAAPGAFPQPHTVFITDLPMSSDTRSRIAALGLEQGDYIDVRAGGFSPTVTQIKILITVVAAALAIVVTLATSMLATLADKPSLDVLKGLGVSPGTWRMLVAAQTATQQVVAGLLGSVIGLLLFWLVTRGDPSVPRPIFPWLPIVVFSVVVPIVAGLLVATLAKPGRPTGHAQHISDDAAEPASTSG